MADRQQDVAGGRHLTQRGELPVGLPDGRVQVTGPLDVPPGHVMVGQIAVGAGHDRVEQLGVVTSRDDDPQDPSGQRRDLDGIQCPGQFGGEHALDILIPHGIGRSDHQVSGMTGEAGGVGPVSQPGAHAGNEV